MLASLLLALATLSAQAPAASRPDTSALVIGARTIVVFRAEFGPTSPPERADLARARIERLLGEGADSVSSWMTGEVSIVALGHFPVFAVVPGDVDSLRGEAMATKVQSAQAELTTVVREYREARSVRSLAESALLAALATLLFILVVRFLKRGKTWVFGKIASVEHETLPLHFPRLARVFNPEGIARPVRGIVTAVVWAVGLSLAYLYATFVLTSFPWTRPAGEALGHVLGTVLIGAARGIRDAIPDMIAIAVIATLAVFMGRGLDRLFRALARGNITLPGMHPETAEPTRRIVKGLLWVFAVIVIYPHLPASDSTAFKGVSVLAGVLVSFGSAGLATQMMSGIALMYSRGYLVGDYVRIGDQEGTVDMLGMLTTRLRTVKDEYITIPNNVVLGGATMNYTAAVRAGHTLTIYSSVTIGYDVPRKQVEALMLEAARGSEGTSASPAPFVLMRSLGDFSIEYQVNAAIDPTRARELPQIYSALHQRVYDAFAVAGVEILSPNYYALRDGNAATLPGGDPPGAAPKQFRVRITPPAG